MKGSEIKTANCSSGEYFKVSVVKISARSDEVKEGLYVPQLDALAKNANFFLRIVPFQIKVKSSVFNDFMHNLL